MKNKTLSLITIAVLMAGTVAFTACKKTRSSSCTPREPDAVEKISFNLAGQSHQAEFFIYKGIQNGYYRETASSAIEENLFQLVKEYCAGKNIALSDSIFAFVLYYDSLITQSPAVTDEHIKGVSVYDVEGWKITHHLFVKNENAEFYEVEKVRVRVMGITSTHLHYYLKNYVFANPQNKSWITIEGKFAENVYKKNIERYYVPFRYEVKDTTEAQSHLELICAFRDDFLYKSEKGKAYIDNFYYLSHEYQNKISIPLALQTALFFKKFTPVMEAFIDPENHLTEIMFTDDLSKSLLKLLNKYEKITDSEEGKAILTSVRADINAFRNKPLQEILAMIN
jgi:hypothetical protein